MKKLLAIILSVMLIGGVAMAESIDWASMSDDAIREEIRRANEELDKRGGNAESSGIEGTEILHTDDVIMTIQSYEEGTCYDDTPALVLNVTIVNSSERKYEFTPHATINGWEVDCSGYFSVDASHKGKDSMRLRLEDADISSVSDVETVEVYLVYPDENYEHYTETEPVVINFK